MNMIQNKNLYKEVYSCGWAQIQLKGNIQMYLKRGFMNELGYVKGKDYELEVQVMINTLN